MMESHKTPHFKYLVVVDIEATCEKSVDSYPHEIIQLPAVLIDTEKAEVVDKVSFFVRPVINPTLSKFCSELTGISQDQVDQAQPFPVVLKEFEKWLVSHDLGLKFSFSIVTDGSYDLGKFFLEQCERAGMLFPKYTDRWVNIRRVFNSRFQVKLPQTNLKVMLDKIGETFEGKPHNGLDDAINITKIVIHLLKLGVNIYQNERIVLGAKEQQENIIRQRFYKGPRWMYLPLVAPISFKEFLKFDNDGENLPGMSFYRRKVKLLEKENRSPSPIVSTCDCKMFCASKQAALVKLMLMNNKKELRLPSNQYFEGELIQCVPVPSGFLQGQFSPQIPYSQQPIVGLGQIGPCTFVPSSHQPIMLGPNHVQHDVMNSHAPMTQYIQGQNQLPGYYNTNMANVFPN